jgi:prephenate dehydrogenase
MFERIAIVGVGLIGGSLALAIRERWPEAVVVAIDSAPVGEAALRMSAAAAVGTDLTAADGSDLIVLAAPVRQNIEMLRMLAERVQGDALVTDVGSTKREIVDAAARLPERLRFVGGHPLAGAAAGGLDAARADLFRDRPWILTPAPNSASADVQRLCAFVSAFGATPTTMEAAYHDHLLAYISHLPQLVVSAMMEVVGEEVGPNGLALAGSGLRDTTRLATSPANTWRDVTATNAEALAEAIDKLRAALDNLKADLTQGNELERVFSAARDWKRVLDASGVGGYEGNGGLTNEATRTTMANEDQ